jgi:flagellar hook-basal body complex protein FliE
MSQIDVTRLLADMRALAAEMERQKPVGEGTGADFGAVLQDSIDKVNDAQQRASDLATAYQLGEDVDLTEVMIEVQKASLAFRAMTEVRNKLVNAYQEIMNMPV